MRETHMMDQDEVKTGDIIWASKQFLILPFPFWGDDFEEWGVEKVLAHISNNKLEVLESIEDREVARMILTTAISFREEARSEAQEILKQLTKVLSSV